MNQRVDSIPSQGDSLHSARGAHDIQPISSVESSSNTEQVLSRNGSADTIDEEESHHVAHPHRRPRLSWMQRIFGIGPTKRGIEGSRIIHPQSPFAQVLSCLSTMLLGYVACVTPITIGFFWTADGCTELPTLKMDMFVDCFFLAEIVYNFFVGIHHEGRYRDEVPFVAKVYVKSSLFFDILTSIPVAIIEYVTIQACFDGEEPSVEAAQLRVVRATKPFRIFKMIRILKTSRLVYVFDWLESEMRPPPFLTRLLRIFFIIAMIVHVCVCAFWLIKDAYDQERAVEEFLEDNGLGAHAKLVDKYVLGMYFVNTVFTTVGFGDIVAENGAERVFYVSVMYVGTLVFGAMLGEVQAAMAQLRRAERERSEAVLEAKDYLREVEATPHLERVLLRWVNFDFDCKRRQARRETMHAKFPPLLRRELAQHIHRETLLKLPVFNELHHPDRHNFMLELYMKMQSTTTCAGHALALAGESADRLHVILHGSVKVTLGATSKDAPAIATLIPGDHLGEYTLFEDTTWQTSQGKPASFWCETHVECLTLTRDDFLSVVNRYPADLEDEAFFLADLVTEMRSRTSEIDDINLLRWCQLLYKVLQRTRRANRDAKRSRSNRTSFKLAVHRHKTGPNRVRKSSILLATSSNLSSLINQPTSPTANSPMATYSDPNNCYPPEFLGRGSSLNQDSGRSNSLPVPKLAPEIPPSRVISGSDMSAATPKIAPLPNRSPIIGENRLPKPPPLTLSIPETGYMEEGFAVSQRLGRLEQLLHTMHTDAQHATRHREMMSQRMLALETSIAEQLLQRHPSDVDGAGVVARAGSPRVSLTKESKKSGKFSARPTSAVNVATALPLRTSDGHEEHPEVVDGNMDQSIGDLSAPGTPQAALQARTIVVDTVATQRKAPKIFEEALFELMVAGGVRVPRARTRTGSTTSLNAGIEDSDPKPGAR